LKEAEADQVDREAEGKTETRRGTGRVRYNDEERARDKELGRNRERDRDRDRGNDNERHRSRKYFNIELNKQVMRISDTRELCDFVLTHAAEFNHVNVSTASLQILKKPKGMPPKSLARALQTLEETALDSMQDFEAQGIANTLHTMVKQWNKTTGPLLLTLERRGEEITVEFKPQEVSNTLWAFATMGTKPIGNKNT
jgi:hypothetical protein